MEGARRVAAVVGATQRRTPGIVDLEKAGKLNAVVTQNIDELHQRAGTIPQLVIEVHGTAWWTRCCPARPPGQWPRPSPGSVPAKTDPPCEVCGGILKSDTISFGQALVPEVIDRAMAVSRSCDVSSPSARR